MSPPASRRPYASNLRPVVAGVGGPDGLIWVIPVTPAEKRTQVNESQGILGNQNVRGA